MGDSLRSVQFLGSRPGRVPVITYRARTMLSGRRPSRVLSAAVVLSAALAISVLVPVSNATPEYSERTEQSCTTCHVGEEPGGKLTEKGLAFAASGYVWPPQESPKVLSPIRRSVRLAIGFIHVLASFMWFGTILYVHIMLRPGYAARGLPKGEVVLGLVSMLLVGTSGVLLTLSRVTSLDVLFSSRWGILLFVKMLLYGVMVCSALFIVIYVGPRLRRGALKAEPPKDGVFGPTTLSVFDGKSGRDAYVAYRGKVYDVTGFELWKDGVHMKHLAGRDLTDELGRAPHGEEKLASLRVVGTYDVGLASLKTFAQKAFYVIAYMNLALVFVVLFVIAYWRWGL